MYLRRLQIEHYGPINNLSVDFPFIETRPKPIILVGANGSGKTIVLSHIVNSLLMAQSKIFPQSSEMPDDKIYKVRSQQYIRHGHEFSYVRLDFDGDFSTTELCYRGIKQDGDSLPAELAGTVPEDFWNLIPVGTSSAIAPTIPNQSWLDVGTSYNSGCVLYFPCDRTESPAWLHPIVLEESASEPELTSFEGETNRLVVNSRSLRTNRNWLIGVLFDKDVLELQLKPMAFTADNSSRLVNVFTGYAGHANDFYNAILVILRTITGKSGTRFGIGPRSHRSVSLMDGDSTIVPSIFQLSSGEVMLLNMCLTILRDFDWSEGQFKSLSDVTGIVIVDEIDVHLHMHLQRSVLPRLLKLFPNVQFVLTTHSPFFVLGMQEEFGDDGFAVCRLPAGDYISPEQFSEFDSAYAAIAESDRFARELQTAVESSTKPILVVEGASDIEYLREAATLLSRTDTLARIDLHDGNGASNLVKYWKGCNERMAEALGRRVLLLFDCDVKLEANSIMEKGNLMRRAMPQCLDHPVGKGIENRFARATLERARAENAAWIDSVEEHDATIGGVGTRVPECWTVSENCKMALCEWLREHGTADDFSHFGEIFDLIDKALDDSSDDVE